MRIAAFVGAIIVSNVITIGGIALVVLASPDRVEPLIWLPIVTVTTSVYGPLVIGSVSSYWDVRATPEAWRYFRWWYVVVFGGQLLGAAAIVVFAVLAGAPAWLPIVFIAAEALLNLLGLRVGPALRRREEARGPAEAQWHPIARASIVRRILIVATTFVVVLAVGSVGFSLLFAFVAAHREGIGTGLLFAMEFAFMAAALACIVVSLRLNRMIREQVSRDVGRLRRIAKVVLRGKAIDLDRDEQVAAAKYAAVVSVSLPFTLAYLALLYVGIGLQQVGQLSSRPDDLYPRAFLAFLVIALVVLLPLYLVRFRRARRYAREHADALPPSDPAGTED